MLCMAPPITLVAALFVRLRVRATHASDALGAKIDNLVLMLVDNEHRARRSANDLFGDAAKKQVGDASASPRSHDDEIDLLFLRIPEDLRDGAARQHCQVRLQLATLGLAEQVVKLIAGFLLDRLFALREGRGRPDVTLTDDPAQRRIVEDMEHVQRGMKCLCQRPSVGDRCF